VSDARKPHPQKKVEIATQVLEMKKRLRDTIIR
jgi:hypothetical protein